MSSVVRVFAVVALMTFPSFAGAQGVDTVWVRQYTNPDDYYGSVEQAVVDKRGNVYIAGQVGENPIADFLTIRFRSNGDTAWVRRYDGPAHWRDIAKGIAVDDAGNVSVTGPSMGIDTYDEFVVIKYDSIGNIVWLRDFDDDLHDGSNWPHRIAVDDSGNVIVTGKSHSVGGVSESADYLTVKYTQSGDSVWAEFYDGHGNDYDEAFALAVDHSGNIYVSGSSTGSGTGTDLITVKYAPNGDTVWVGRYDGPDHGDDEDVFAVAADDSGNVYITGSSLGIASAKDCTTIKYRSDGVTDWVHRYDGPASYDDVGLALALDAGGSVHVAGVSYGIGTHFDYLTIKLNPSGDTSWVRRFNGAGDEMDYAVDLALDAEGGVYITGSSYNGTPTSDDIVTIKYTASGDLEWQAAYNDPYNFSDHGRGIGLDAVGNTYVAGFIGGMGWAFVAIKYATCCRLRGDVDHSGIEPIDIADLVYLVDYMFNQGPPPPCWDDGDIDGSGIAPIDIADLVYLVDYMFNAGPPPPPCP